VNRFQFVADHRHGFEVKRLCEVLDVARSSFYAWLDAEPAPTARGGAAIVGGWCTGSATATAATTTTAALGVKRDGNDQQQREKGKLARRHTRTPAGRGEGLCHNVPGGTAGSKATGGKRRRKDYACAAEAAA